MSPRAARRSGVLYANPSLVEVVTCDAVGEEGMVLSAVSACVHEREMSSLDCEPCFAVTLAVYRVVICHELRRIRSCTSDSNLSVPACP